MLSFGYPNSTLCRGHRGHPLTCKFLSYSATLHTFERAQARLKSPACYQPKRFQQERIRTPSIHQSLRGESLREKYRRLRIGQAQVGACFALLEGSSDRPCWSPTQRTKWSQAQDLFRGANSQSHTATVNMTSDVLNHSFHDFLSYPCPFCLLHVNTFAFCSWPCSGTVLVPAFQSTILRGQISIIKAKKKTCTTRVLLPSSLHAATAELNSLTPCRQACSFALPFGPCLRNLQFETVSKQAGRGLGTQIMVQREFPPSKILSKIQTMTVESAQKSNVTFFLTTASTRFPLQIQIQGIQLVKWKH